ncbi:glycosyltransferase family 39 protein [Mangrovibacterium marinum]|uniref:4-amino-4-deoxy-L-arabinose transferase-like glycosyltransferase n=1 Tax=Mangrovibacterium marinum TaxID=1639118 RepID=A0A2T5C098_9BACT|nr:glycosyltransferase family 39 protein [Mangrovibacterium marinum]PTN08009.1 4-amino-4-deoxy-L-arabinose transferase-like glycosyltransferase [Mangrovibacterium marinum]
MKKLVWLLPLIVICLLVNVSGVLNPLVVNAAKYAQVAREILHNHDWVNMTIGHEPYEQKPPLLFWIGATAFSLFGVSGIVYKATVLLVALLGAFASFKLGELLYDRMTGKLAAFFWITSLGFIHFHSDIHTDTLLAVPVMLAIWQFAAYFKYKREYQFYLGAVFVGMAMLTKGPVGMVIPGAAVGTHLLLTRNFKGILNYRWLLAIPIVFIVILPALIGLFQHFGIEGLKFYFWTNNVGRVTGSYKGTNSDPFFYIHTSLYMLAPWMVFAFVGLVLQLREKIVQRNNPLANNEYYTLGGLLFYLVIASIAKQKNPHYEMAVLPLFLLIGARWAVIIYEQTNFRKLKKVVSGIHLFIGIVLVVAVYPFLLYFFPNAKAWVWVIVVILTGMYLYAISWKNSLHRQLTSLFLAISIFMFTLNTHILPNLAKYHAPVEACKLFNEQAPDGAALHIYTGKARYWGIFFYSKNYGQYLVTEDDLLAAHVPAGDWLFTSAEGLESLDKLQIRYQQVKEMDHRSLSRISMKFINPKTRASKLEKLYLVRLTE